MAVFGVVIIMLGFLLIWPTAKAAGDSDKKLNEFFEAFLLREEISDGNCSKEA